MVFLVWWLDRSLAGSIDWLSRKRANFDWAILESFFWFVWVYRSDWAMKYDFSCSINEKSFFTAQSDLYYGGFFDKKLKIHFSFGFFHLLAGEIVSFRLFLLQYPHQDSWWMGFVHRQDLLGRSNPIIFWFRFWFWPFSGCLEVRSLFLSFSIVGLWSRIGGGQNVHFPGQYRSLNRNYYKMIITKSLKIPSKKMPSILFDSWVVLTVGFFLIFFDFVSRDHASGFFIILGLVWLPGPKKRATGLQKFVLSVQAGSLNPKFVA